jgi:NADPH2:quinone reductase
MSKGLVAFKPGGPEALVWSDLPMGNPGPGEVLLRHTAIGVNFIDVYYRSGLYAWPEAIMIPGGEAAGVVEAVGSGVTAIGPGDRVAYVTPQGAYRERRIMPADRLVPIPDGINDETAASVMLKGLTAQYLITSSYAVKPGDTVLVHAAAGGVGLLLGQWLNALGVHAIGTAGSHDKVALALQHGYEYVVNYREEDFVPVVKELTAGRGCAAVYDSVGQDTWRGSLKCLQRFGMFVNFGQSSGPIRDFTLSDLAAGSLSANRPVLFDYVASREDLEARAADLFSRLLVRQIRADVVTEYPLRQAAEVHSLLESRQTAGATVLIP